MRKRYGLPYLTIPLQLFQDFDQGQPIEVLVPAGWNLQVEDQFTWSCGSERSGFATVSVCQGSDAANSRVVISKVP
ncbi:MAG: hypothetical protein UU95_C0043G0010 [Parcubacteria group bacterium GW2011_GWC2_42_12]|uniref:Uncharacterized protein n=1 Tax=Candidatus Falkowbacteria bacterium RIFCSPHIGHO2_02_FULL_42_9 TaxID=1797986 RepID=A0A1F5S767_9BACT|nr:MAG: hypothetical protein UU95_C0043G0010 [Parcubacteria group bacterium GW2011_GWC2_42_12]OGF22509.1 MAG: hypothetical protein A3D45_00305 [Candidatus Falkowbacteria bacterium RIFCSPHIGHO2_02_FULL_42_9]